MLKLQLQDCMDAIIETNEENLLKEKVLQAFISGEYILSHIKQQR